ncbi:MAG: VWA domain-containing protein [Acidobacteria bacterium]|nr:MAG: VWA domain-containing protein [Acidobacteriota bacterium]REK02828.1 MAG: VWA domain-containing protein [Acidobacteriota bacterium]REK13368.1 MAG: VWA domain-containing protein [Acidobacteriota bacterium]REK41362.1 MAG: VWA domain-containing protein [Acidobacteriota bacterium]
MKRAVLLFGVFVCLSAGLIAQDGSVTQGTLTAYGDTGGLGACPLKHTSVQADISGFLARVTVKQEFENTFGRAIEAVYTFPLSEKGAVDRMRMTIGSRVIEGRVRSREEARQLYEQAKTEGKIAALLDQERPNIFTQSVANILPGEKIVVEISYVETLKYEDGEYEFVFPMVVAERYIPGGTASGDPAKISPAISAARSGHDVSINVSINAGVPIEKIESKLHEIDSQSFGAGNASVNLRNQRTIPNKDFILRYEVTGKNIEDAVLTHRADRGGFFTFILQPPDLNGYEDVAPKEIVFVLDTSGSMGGFPIEKAKEAMMLSLEGLYPDDTFNLITFAGDTHVLFDAPVRATAANLDAAKAFLRSRSGGGGTEMMKAIKAALEPTDSQEHTRIVCFMTDGHVGNDNQIIDEVRKHPKARVFSFGIGNGVNRYLLEKIAQEGNGEAAFVTLEDDGSLAARKFYERVRAPLLTDISIEWNGLPVKDLYPQRIPDLFSAKPVIINGRYESSATGSLVLKGRVGGQDYQREIKVDLPEKQVENDVLGTLWARQMIDLLSSEDYEGTQNRTADKELGDLIRDIGLEFGIVTQYTSFIAVEEVVRNPEGNPARMDVPVEKGDKGEEPVLNSPSLPAVMSTEANVDVKVKERGKQKVSVNGGSSGSGGLIVSGSGTGTGSGRGTGSGSGTGTGRGTAKTANATVTVSGGRSSTNTSSGRIETAVSKETIQALPLNTRFTSLLKLSPGVTPTASSGGFQIDGATGSENVFVVDGQEVSEFRVGLPGPIAVAGEKIAKPEFPAGAKPGKKGKKITVEIRVDENGRVTFAKAIEGDKAYRQSAEKAALESKFTPAEFDGVKLKMEGVVSYLFREDDAVWINVEKLKAIFTPELLQRQDLKKKLHFWVFEVVVANEAGKTAPPKYSSRFVNGDVAQIRVAVTDPSPAVLKKLKKTGLQIGVMQNGLVSGSIEVGKIANLAKLDEVLFISP